jgi:predicted DNA-binding transcriptional regulator
MVSKQRSNRKTLAAVPGMADRATAGAHALAAIGLSDVQARIYCRLVDHPGSTTADIADGLGGLSRREVAAALAHLTQLGLASHSAERDARYRVTPPDIAIEALINQRQVELQVALQNARDLATNLATRVRGTLDADEREEPMVEVLAGPEASRAVYAQLQAAAQREVIAVERPPYVLGRPPAGSDAEQLSALRRGVRYRGVLAASALEVPGRLAILRADLAAGEDTRVLADVPVKYMLVDRRVAIMPLYAEEPARATILVRSPGLIAALHELFESLWARATPVYFSESSGELLTRGSKPDTVSDFAELVAMLAAGLNDKSIADQLGISARTLDRRIETLLSGLDARTRFQAGWQAARRHNGKPKQSPHR